MFRPASLPLLVIGALACQASRPPDERATEISSSDPADALSSEPPADPTEAGHASDPNTERARRIAAAVLQKLGGRKAWQETRHVHWKIPGPPRREHWWDKHTGNARIELEHDGDRLILLLNPQSGLGRAFRNDVEVEDARSRDHLLALGVQTWVVDSDVVFLPYRLRDPGVRLAYRGEAETTDGRAADALEVSFAATGTTPASRYLVLVVEDSGLVEEWAVFEPADAAEPGPRQPWRGWRRFGQILLATDRGDGADWDIAVYESMSDWVYTRP